MSLLTASGKEHMKAGHGAGCDAERHVHHSASHTRDTQALSKLSSGESSEECLWEERETIKEICELPAEEVVLQLLAA